MSHADEGTLHAYLDGELTAVERAGLETHLAGCAACRARLAEERELAGRARDLLARAVPPDRAVPPARRTAGGSGGGGGAARPLPRWVPIAWAASVLVAMGGGWLARGGGSRVEAPAADAVARGYLQDDYRAPVAESRDEEQAQEPADTRPPALAQREGPAAKTRAEAEREQAAGANVALPRAGERADRLAQGAAPAPAAQAIAPREEITVTSAAPLSLDGRTTSISVDSARVILGAAPVTIPDLVVRRIEVAVPSDGIVVVEQVLDTNTVVRLYQRRADAAGDQGRVAAEAAPAPGAAAQRYRTSERLARYVGSLRVEIAGPLGADSLSKLLGRVR